MAYEMGLVLQGIYEWEYVGESQNLFGNWCAWVRAMREQTGELLEPKARVARMIEGHLEGILGHYTQGLMTAFTEGFNSLFSAIKRNNLRYRMPEYVTAIIYFVSGKLTLWR